MITECAIFIHKSPDDFKLNDEYFLESFSFSFFLLPRIRFYTEMKTDSVNREAF